MQRLPDGIDGKAFFQKEVPDYFPDWIVRQQVEKKDGQVCHVIANNIATLVYLADQGCITPHVWLSRRDKLDYPDRLILDLDPSGNDFVPMQQAAQHAHALFDALGLRVYAMTTGSRGLHLAVPLDCSQTFNQVLEFIKQLARSLAKRHPEVLTTATRKKDRGNSIYLDVARNAYGQHAAAPYAVRPRPGAPVATPLNWDEVSSASLSSDRYCIQTIFRQLAQKDDPWQGMQKHEVNLKAAQKTLSGRDTSNHC